MWLDEFLTEAQALKEDPSRRDGGLEFELFQIWPKIGIVLRTNLGPNIDGVQALLAAGLLYNPYSYTGATWHEMGSEYGSTRSPEAIDILTKARDKLIEVENGSEMEVERARQSATWRIKEYSQPNWAHVQQLTEDHNTDLIDLLGHLIVYHEGCIETEGKKRGTARALRTAIALRAVFEEYADETATSGDWGDEPSGPFCTCLKSVYEIAKVNGTFRLRIPGFADSGSDGARTLIPGCADKIRAGC